MLAVTAMGALPLGPLGSIAAIVFGWAARREIERSRSRLAGYALATVAMALGVVLTMAWGGAIATWAWAQSYRERVAPIEEAPPIPGRPAARPPAAAPPAAAAPAPPASIVGPGAPRTTKLKREGNVTVVDIGVSASSLSEELAKQRAEASGAGETMVVMTTAARCDPCRGVDQSIRDPLLQTALAKIRLVRVDIEVFREDLDALRIPHSRFPGFFLLAPDLTPRDGIDGGEWDDDIPRNIAPVLGAFVRGRYATRRKDWQPLPGSGIRL